MSFASVVLASAIGQGITLYIVGVLAQRAERKKAERIQRAFTETMNELAEKEKAERERISRYAQMES